MTKSNEQMMVELGLKTEDLYGINISVEVLYAIYIDYKKYIDQMETQAEYRARILNACEEVNSVKWRVKDPLHLIKKIIRKKKESSENPKYADISVSNYRDIITDLIGLRVIFIFKAHWSLVDEYIFNKLNVCPDNPITIYHANDDNLTFFPSDSSIKKHEGLTFSYKLEKKDSRYRSIHYILQGEKHTGCKMELQARSILDEAWGEIDHHVRYPDNTNHPELLRKMSILNGQISGCEEHASQSYEYFTELEITKLKESKSKPSETLENETVVIELIEDSAKAEDYVEDKKNSDSYEKSKAELYINSPEDFDPMSRLSKILKSIQPLRAFEGSDKKSLSNIEAINQALGASSASANLEKALKNLRQDELSNKKSLSNIEAINQALGASSASANLEKALKNLRQNELSNKKSLSNIEAMKRYLNNNNDDDNS